jgi:hypothetical protein
MAYNKAGINPNQIKHVGFAYVMVVSNHFTKARAL